MEFNRDNLKKVIGVILFTIVVYVCLQNTKMVSEAVGYVFELLMPFLIGGCLAFVLNVPMRFFENKLFSKSKNKFIQKSKRVFSLIATIAVVIGGIMLVARLVLPSLSDSVRSIAAEAATAEERIPEWLDLLSEKLPLFSNEFASLKKLFFEADWNKIGRAVITFLQNGTFLSDTFSFASTLVSGVVDFAIGLVFAFYILVQKETLGRQSRRLFYAVFPEAKVDYFLRVCKLTSGSFSHFLSGQCLEALILGMMFFVSMMVLQMHTYALVISVLIGVTALIPVFGAFIGCVIGFILIFLINPLQALEFIVLFIVLQQIEGNLIYPHVVGNSVGLPSIWVLVAVTLGANLSGVLGMLFAVPLTSVIYVLVREAVDARIKRRAIDDSKLE